MKKQLVYILGLKRNGNHAIINWIIKNLEKNKIQVGFINDVNEKVINDGDIDKIISDNLVTILSYEEISIHEFEKIKYKNNKLDFKEILILRDFKNSFASRLKYISEFKSDSIDIYDYFMNHDEYKKNWIEFSEVFLDKIQNKWECINYNLWFSDKTYRDSVMNNIFDIKNYDLGLLSVPKNAGGSSFDYLKYNNRAKDMNILERWKFFAKEPFFNNFVLSDHKVVDLDKKIFDI